MTKKSQPFSQIEKICGTPNHWSQPATETYNRFKVLGTIIYIFGWILILIAFTIPKFEAFVMGMVLLVLGPWTRIAPYNWVVAQLTSDLHTDRKTRIKLTKFAASEDWTTQTYRFACSLFTPFLLYGLLTNDFYCTTVGILTSVLALILREHSSFGLNNC